MLVVFKKELLGLYKSPSTIVKLMQSRGLQCLDL